MVGREPISSAVAARAVLPASCFSQASKNSLDQPQSFETAMPSRRHKSAMLSSPQRPCSTMLIFTSDENCHRISRRMSLITHFAGFGAGPVVCLIFAPRDYDEPTSLRS